MDKWIGAAPRMRAISGLFGSRPSIGFPNWQECSETPDSWTFFFIIIFLFFTPMKCLCAESGGCCLQVRNFLASFQHTHNNKKKKKAPTATSAPLTLNALHFNMWFIWGCFKSLSLSQRNRCTREAIPSVRDVK